MAESGFPPNRSDDAQRQRRLEALRGLAHDVEVDRNAEQPAQTASGAPSVTLRVSQPRRRKLLVSALGALALIAAVVGVFARGPIAALLAGHSGPTLTTHLVMLGDRVNLYCPSSPVWSPDGRQIAVLAQTSPPGGCGTPSYGQILLSDALSSTPPTPHYAIGIIDVASGRVARTLPFLLPTISALCGARCAPKDGYTPLNAWYNPLDAISWSPDGKTVGFFFAYNVSYVKMAINGVQVNGVQWYGALQLIPVSGLGGVRTLLATSYVEPGPDKPYPITFFHSSPVYTWNLTTGASSYSAMPDETGEATSPFAAAYGWTASGRIAPQASASAGAATFSPWIGGQLRMAGASSRVFEYTASLWRWSPDGQYVAPNLTIQAFVHAPGVLDEPPPIGSGNYAPPLVVAPDPAMASLLKEISRQQMSAEIAWSPNGKLLAGLDCSHGADTARLTVRRASDWQGKLSATFTYPPTINSGGCDGDMEALAWSSDNASVATSDPTIDEVAIWRYSA